MMPDIGMMELLVIGIVALIVVGPKDLPKMFRTFGQVTGRIRGMAKEFTRAMNDAADDSGMKDLSKDLRSMTNPKKMGMDAVNKAFDDIDPRKFEDGSETKAMAEKRAAAAKEARAKAEAVRKSRENEIRQGKLDAMSDVAETSHEPELPESGEEPARAAPPKRAAAKAAPPAETGAEATENPKTAKPAPKRAAKPAAKASGAPAKATGKAAEKPAAKSSSTRSRRSTGETAKS